jgi:hypothetical protein
MSEARVRELNRDEAVTLRLREERFDAFLSERMPVLAEFAASTVLAEPVLTVADPVEVAQANPRVERELRSAYPKPDVSRRLGAQRRGPSGAAFHVAGGSKTSVVP